MEIIRSTFLLCFSLGIFLLLLNHANAGEDPTTPWKNSNLSPFEQWRSAYFCLQIDTSAVCKPNDILKFGGWLNLENSTEVEEYCGECAHQTLTQVINCIELVHRHFIFESGAPLSFVKDKIVKSCSSKQAFNTSYKADPNSATSLYSRLHLPLISAIALIIATFTY